MVQYAARAPDFVLKKLGLSVTLAFWGLSPNATFAQTAFGQRSQAITLAIPLNPKSHQPAPQDLQGPAGALSASQADTLQKQGQDLSLLDPVASDFFSPSENNRPKPHPSSQLDFPLSDVPEAQWVGHVPRTPRGWFRAQIKAQFEDANSDSGRRFQHRQIVLSPLTHQYLLRAEILRKMGYAVDPLRWLKRLKIHFPDRASKEDFLLRLENGVVDRHRSRWVVEESPTSVLLKDVVIEHADPLGAPQAFAMGLINATRVAGSRVARGLIVPFVLADVPEILEHYRTDCARIQNQNLIVEHPEAAQFSETAIDDFRWATRRIAGWSVEDWKAIVQASHYPKEIAPLLTELLIACRNKLVGAALTQEDLKRLSAELPFNLNLTEGVIVNGKLPLGYRSETHAILPAGLADPEAPVQPESVKRFFRVESTNGLLNQLISRVNENLLELRGADAIARTRQENLQKQFENHLKSTPHLPFTPQKSPWTEVVGGFTASANRSIVTGSYFGAHTSDYKMNLVDQVSIGGRVGLVAGIDGLPRVSPGLNANMSRVRSYVHVRPVSTIQAAEYTSWRDLIVPGFMLGLVEMIADPDALQAAVAQQSGGPLQNLSVSINEFLKSFGEDETLIISESDVLSGTASLNSSLSQVLNISPMSFANSISIGVQASRADVKRIMITRDQSELKVYLQGYGSVGRTLYFGLTYWLDLLRVSRDLKDSTGTTRAFRIPIRSNLRDDVKLARSIRGLLRSADPEILEMEYEHAGLSHSLTANWIRAKFLFWRWTQLEEWHKLLFTPARTQPCSIERSTVDEQCVYDKKTQTASIQIEPQKFQRSLGVHRLLDRSGKNYLGLASDIFDGFAQNSSQLRPGFFAGANTPNPRDSFYGSAVWRTVTAEGELTPVRDFSPRVTISSNWGGWDLSQQDLYRVFDAIEARVRSIFENSHNISLIDRTQFARTQKLQLYEIRSVLMVFETALQVLDRNLRKVGPIPGQKTSNVLRELSGWDEYSESDPEFVNQILVPLVGRDHFINQCYLIRADRLSKNLPEYFSLYGQDHYCLFSWMEEALRLRRSGLSAHRKERLQTYARWIALLEKNVELNRLIPWLGEENVYFQVSVNGFRVGDKLGDASGYVSGTVGKINSRQRESVFEELSRTMSISTSEIYASYLSEAN